MAPTRTVALAVQATGSAEGDRGEREEVLRLWDNFVPPLLRKSDKNAQKLEFYLNIFFAIYPLHPTNPKPQPAGLATSMRTFKTYLETDGASLAVTPEFLAYYAMPYVPEIARHPSFKELFTSEWALALKARLADFLARTCALCILNSLSHTLFFISLSPNSSKGRFFLNSSNAAFKFSFVVGNVWLIIC